jgi:hypothetical protein
MSSSLPFIVLCSLFQFASCSFPPGPTITAPAVLRRVLQNDPALMGFATDGTTCKLLAFCFLSCLSDVVLGSQRDCYGDYTYSDFGTVADCCPDGEICHPATDCSAADGTLRVVLYQGGDASTWYGLSFSSLCIAIFTKVFIALTKIVRLEPSSGRRVIHCQRPYLDVLIRSFCIAQSGLWVCMNSHDLNMLI